MKITKQELKEIIRNEVNELLNEASPSSDDNLDLWNIYTGPSPEIQRQPEYTGPTIGQGRPALPATPQQTFEYTHPPVDLDPTLRVGVGLASLIPAIRALRSLKPLRVGRGGPEEFLAKFRPGGPRVQAPLGKLARPPKPRDIPLGKQWTDITKGTPHNIKPSTTGRHQWPHATKIWDKIKPIDAARNERLIGDYLKFRENFASKFRPRGLPRSFEWEKLADPEIINKYRNQFERALSDAWKNRPK